MQSTQEIVELILDSNRNALLALDLKISILTMGIGIGTLVAGVFGMNVRRRQIRAQLPRSPWGWGGGGVPTSINTLTVYVRHS